jgi:hypothetical protein
VEPVVELREFVWVGVKEVVIADIFVEEVIAKHTLRCENASTIQPRS